MNPPVDPWGHPLRVDRNGQDFYVRSAGEDGKFGTADDVQYPEWNN